MSTYNDVEKAMHNGKEYLQEEGKKVLQKGACEMMESGKDWWSYVEKHPMQSMIFGVIGYFALKGLLKN